jgi:hypothetical protein
MSFPNRRSRYIRVTFSMIVFSITLVFLTVALPELIAPAGAPRETGALKAITTIHTAEVQYYYSYNRFAASLTELGPPASGADGPSAAGLIERDLASGDKGGRAGISTHSQQRLRATRFRPCRISTAPATARRTSRIRAWKFMFITDRNLRPRMIRCRVKPPLLRRHQHQRASRLICLALCSLVSRRRESSAHRLNGSSVVAAPEPATSYSRAVMTR